MAADTIYSLIYVTVNNGLLTEHGSVSVRRTTNAQVVSTVAKGFAGMSPGSPMCEIEVSNAIPNAGFEYNAEEDMLALQNVEIGLQVGGKIFVSKGFIIEDSFQHSTDSPSGLSFRFVGTFPKGS